MHATNFLIVYRGTLDPREYVETLIRAVVRREPSGSLGNEHDDNEHGNDAEALENDRYPPGVTGGVL